MTLVSDDTVAGAANDATELVPPVTQAAPELAWSSEEPATEVLSRPWRSVWTIAGLGVLVAVVVAVAVMAFAMSGRQWPTPAGVPYRPPAAALPPGSPTPSPKPPPDDDEFVAVAISPPDIARTLADGTGTAGSQERADEIALDECRAVPGNAHCILVNAGMRHGCVAFALDASRNAWSSGSGPTAESARAAAVTRLGTPASGTGVQCSDPPGILRLPVPTPSPAAHKDPLPTAAVTPTQVATARPSQADLDERFLSDLTAAGLQITDVPTVIAGGHNVCRFLAAGHTEADAVRIAMSNNASLLQSNAQSMVESAVEVYCPDQQ